MTVNEIFQSPDACKHATVRPEKRENTSACGKSDVRANSRQTSAHGEVWWRILSLGIFFTSGATVAGGLAALIFDGFFVALSALIGGVLGMFIGALCHVAGDEPPELKLSKIHESTEFWAC